MTVPSAGELIAGLRRAGLRVTAARRAICEVLAEARADHMSAGDVIVIPEGVPHMVDTRNSRLVYLVIKEDVVR